MKWLSAEELVACSKACRALHALGRDPAQWRRLCVLRWGSSLAQNIHGRHDNWRAVYFEKDREEIEAARKLGAESELFMQAQAARRSEVRAHTLPSLPSWVPPANVCLAAQAERMRARRMILLPPLRRRPHGSL